MLCDRETFPTICTFRALAILPEFYQNSIAKICGDLNNHFSWHMKWDKRVCKSVTVDNKLTCYFIISVMIDFINNWSMTYRPLYALYAKD